MYDWSANGMLKQVTNPEHGKIRFGYDPLGRRIFKETKKKRTNWLWDGNVPLHEWESHSTESLINVVIWIFEGGFVPCAKVTQDKSYSIVTDYLGTPTQMFDQEGQNTWDMELDIYGKVRTFKGSSLNDCPFRYQGQYLDQETGLYYNCFRYYDPEVGSYISQDPIGLLGGMNLYSYVSDTNYWLDILGLQAWNKTEVLDRTVYQNDDLFDVNKKSSWKDPITGDWKYGTNVERISDEVALIGKDGKSVQLHHLTQTESAGFNGKKGSLVEISTTSHQRYSKQLHMPTMRDPNNPKKTLPRYPSFRKNNDGSLSKQATDFDKFRSNYWMERANKIKNGH